MTDSILEFTFDDITSIDSADTITNNEISEIKVYEKIFLYKRQDINTQLVNDIAPLKEMDVEVFANMTFEGSQRYYLQDLTERHYNLESTTPYKVIIKGRVVQENAWGEMLCKVALLLLELNPEKKGSIYDFRCPWSKVVIFSKEKRTNGKMLFNDLYLNCNHTALHSCWLLQDLLDYFDIDKSSVKFLLHRPCVAESSKVTAYIKERFIRGFVFYLIDKRKKTSEQAIKVVKIIEKHLNPILKTFSKSYPDFFLFDNNNVLYGYVKKVKEKLTETLKYNEKEKKVLSKYMDYLHDYYRL